MTHPTSHEISNDAKPGARREAPAARRTVKAQLYRILEAGHSHEWTSRFFEAAMATLIILNVVAFTVETVPSIHDNYAQAFRLFDIISILIFTVEYGARLWVCTEHPPFAGLPPLRARLKFARSPLMVVDFLAVAPFYLSFLFAIDLRVLRILRLLRFFKLARFSPAFNTMLRVLSRERDALLGVLMVLIGMVIIAASLLYLVEHDRPDGAFATVPAAMWWAIATLTTVGYGDVTPITPLGQFIAGIVMICGLGFFALPIGIIASAFMDEFRRQDFIVTWGMAARAPIFSSLSPGEIAELLGVLKARTAPPGSLIATDGERQGSLFMIGAGSVEIRDVDRPELAPVTLEEGRYWGARSLLTGVQGETAIALGTCDLIVLDEEDFRGLGRTRPHLHSKLMSSLRAAPDPFKQGPSIKDDPQTD